MFVYSWTLQDKCQSHNRGGSSERLWPHLLRFVSSAVRLLYVHPSTTVEGNGSLMHILRILYKSFEQDDQSQVYELNTLKTILDVLTHSTAALLKLRIHGTKMERAESEDFTTVVTSLLQHVTQTVVSFSTSSKSSSNKGRSIVRVILLLIFIVQFNDFFKKFQSCSQLIGHLMALLPKRCDSLAYQDLDWLVRLLQYPDAVVKTAALEMLNQISFLPQVFDHVADVFDLLKDQDESCSVLQQAALVVSQHPKRVTEEALFNACRLLSNSGLWINQNLAQSLCLVLANVIHSDVDPTHLQTIVNEAVPALPTILTAGDSIRPEVKAVAFNILVRVASFHSNVAVWLLKQIGNIQISI